MQRFQGKLVLVVEDEALIAMLIEQMLVDLGAEVLGPAAGPEEALALLDGPGAPDAAVMDVNLGGQRVDPVAAALAARGIPFLLVTGYGQAGGLGLPGARAVLGKPFQPPDLVLAMARLFE